MYTSASPSLPQPYHGISVAGFFVVVTPPLMCVLTSSFSDGGRKHFSPPEFRTLQLPPPPSFLLVEPHIYSGYINSRVFQES